MGILNTEQKECMITTNDETIFDKNGIGSRGKGHSEFLSHSELFKPDNKFLENEKLIVFCEVSFYSFYVLMRT